MRRTCPIPTRLAAIAALVLGAVAIGRVDAAEPVADARAPGAGIGALLASAEPAAPVVLLPGPRLPGAEPEPAIGVNDAGIDAFWAETLAVLGGMAEKDAILRDWTADLEDHERAAWESRLAELAQRRAALELRLDGFSAQAGGRFGTLWSRFQAEVAHDRAALDAAYGAALKEMGGTM